LLGVWIDAVHGRKPLKSIVLEWIARSVQPVVARRGQPITATASKARMRKSVDRSSDQPNLRAHCMFMSEGFGIIFTSVPQSKK
jgi:hypothetical protein